MSDDDRKFQLDFHISPSTTQKIYFGLSVVVTFCIGFLIYTFSLWPFHVVGFYTLICGIGYFGYLYNHEISYYLYLIHVLFLPSLSILFLDINLNQMQLYIGSLLLLVLPFIILGIHLYTKKKYYLISNINQIVSMVLVPLLFILSIFLPNPSLLNNDARLLIFCLFILFFISFSIPNLNKKNYESVLCKNLQCNSIINLLLKYSKSFTNISTIKQSDKDLMFLYFSEGIESFIEGDLYGAFLSIFKLCLEGTFNKYATINNYEDIKKKYVEIRDSLSHAKISDYFKSADDLKNIRKSLYEPTLDIIKISKFEFMDKVIK